MTPRKTLVVAAVGAILAVATSSCSSGPPPFGHPTTPGEQCIPLAGAKVVTDGMEGFQNSAATTAIVDKIALRKPKGLLLDRAWVVPTDHGLYGAAHGYPPQRYFQVPGWHWDRRQLADGAKVPPLSTGKYFRMNIVVVVRLVRGVSRGTAAGIDMWYHVGANHYYLRFETALVAVKHRC
jgi:hypothetical protein